MTDEEVRNQEFQMKALQRLAEIATRLSGVESHLETLNGKVVLQEKESAVQRLEWERELSAQRALVITHQRDCPLQIQIDFVEKYIAGLEAAKTANRSWMHNLGPVFYGVGSFIVGAIFILILKHADTALKIVGK